MIRGPAIRADEQARILTLLRTRPLPEVKQLTGRPYRTLVRLLNALEAA